MNDILPPSRHPAQTDTHVYTIGADQSFVDALAGGIWDKANRDPLTLADMTIIVPNRQTAQDLKHAFSALMGDSIHIMPAIQTPGDISTEDTHLKIADHAILSEALLDVPPPISRLERQILLAREIMTMPEMAASPQKALQLGGELGRFLDHIQQHGVELKNLEYLVPPQFKRQWAKTARFLEILTDRWPAMLADLGRIDPQDHINIFTQMQLAYWRDTPPQKPVIAAGFVEMDAVTLDLLSTVARLPHGAVVFAGMADTSTMNDADWSAVDPAHPQWMYKTFLDHAAVPRDAVQAWPFTAQPSAAAPILPAPVETAGARQKLLSEALRPAATADTWSRLKKPAPAKAPHGRKDLASRAASALNDLMTRDAPSIPLEALSGLDVVTTATPQEEASVIALKMRETLETPGRTATLVTPDASLARRVSARLRHWGIDVTPEIGHSLADGMTGAFIAATAHMAAQQLAPIPLLETLKHRLSALGSDHAALRRDVDLIEDLCLHGPRPAPGFAGLRQSLSSAFNRNARRLDDAQKAAALQRIDALETAAGAFCALMAEDAPQPFAALLNTHIAFMEQLADTGSDDGAHRVWQGDDGVQAARFLRDLRASAHLMPAMTGKDYAAVIESMTGDVHVKPANAASSRLRIMPPGRARLSRADVMIAGGLNDGSWPKPQTDNPWLSPSMLDALGLPPAAADSAVAALDFALIASHPSVLMTRAERNGNAPSVPSPYLSRLDMVLKGAGLHDAASEKNQLLAIHQALHTPADVTPVRPPAPAPALKIRPKELPVTAVESLLRDPYSVYARYVLKLYPKDGIDTLPDAAAFGNFIHDVLDAFTKKYPAEMPEDAIEQLTQTGRDIFDARLDTPAARAFWWPRFERIATWFVTEEIHRRAGTRPAATEVKGSLEIAEGFVITARADRIDVTANNGLIIIDYKTGVPPTQKSVERGLSPQLTLEALIAEAGGFKGVDSGTVEKLEYWNLKGRRPAGKITSVKANMTFLKQEALSGVSALAAAFNDPKTPYLSVPDPRIAPRFNRYQHLSRYDEWRFHDHTAPEKTKTKVKPKAKSKAKPKAAPAKKKQPAKKGKGA